MTEPSWIDLIIYFYNDSWRVMAFVYGATWALKIAKKVLGTI